MEKRWRDTTAGVFSIQFFHIHIKVLVLSFAPAMPFLTTPKMITVKQLIEHLQTLDQDRGVWIEYDSIAVYSPSHFEWADEMDVCSYGQKGIRTGDYIFRVG